jgi:hypothetical protein
MRTVLLAAFALALLPPAGARAATTPVTAGGGTVYRLIRYRAHDGVERNAWLLLPAGYAGGPIPLVISPRGRGVGAAENAGLWDFEGTWAHTAEMTPDRRLARALARFGLLPWRDAPAVRELRPEPALAA